MAAKKPLKFWMHFDGAHIVREQGPAGTFCGMAILEDAPTLLVHPPENPVCWRCEAAWRAADGTGDV